MCSTKKKINTACKLFLEKMTTFSLKITWTTVNDDEDNDDDDDDGDDDDDDEN